MDIHESARVLAGGIDRLDLSVVIKWENSIWFAQLVEAKEQAQSTNDDAPITIETPDGPLSASVKPTGADGHEWVVRNHDFGMSVGNWIEPKQRPSMSVQLRSEAIWHEGVDKLVARIRRMIESLGGRIEGVKVSRLDLCTDILVGSSDWTRDIENGLVTRARDINPHTQHRELTGFSIGKNQIMARFYDKPIEIARQSNKLWMFDIWGIDEIPRDHKIIRIEFQLRRERIKELSVDTYDQLEERLSGIWAYCTQKWLRVVEDATLHHTQQQIRQWWTVVQDGYPGAQQAQPLVCNRATNNDREILARQALGCLASMFAIELRVPLGPDDLLPMKKLLYQSLADAVELTAMSEDDYSQRVREKQGKRWRHGNLDAGAFEPDQISSEFTDSEA